MIINTQNIILILIGFLFHNIKTRYKLHKDFNNKKEIKLVDPPKFKEDLQINTKHLEKSSLYGEIITFKSRLERDINKKDLLNMYNNLKTLKTEEKIILPYNLLGIMAGGCYNPKNNKIKILKFFKNEVINHELFHMASTPLQNNKNISICGFHQHRTLPNNYIGEALNEGYTEALANRYFDVDNCTSKIYKLCEFYSIKLEEIIGQDTMQKLYLTGDLPGLVKKLRIYDTKENIINFIYNLDFIKKYISILSDSFIINKKDLKEKIILKLSEINNTLIKWYIKMKQNELKENEININEFMHAIDTYCHSIMYYTHFDKKTGLFVSPFKYKTLEKLEIPTKEVEQYSQVKILKKRYDY